jgi:[ribosomal protein S5]-alanine N-acetyltransferase
LTAVVWPEIFSRCEKSEFQMKDLNRKTKRLQIRVMNIRDFRAWRDAHLRMSSPKNLWDFGSKPLKELTLTKFKKVLLDQKKRRETDSFYDLAVFHINGNLIGGVSIMEVVRGISQTAFLGYRIYNNFWRLGYGLEAVKAMIEIGFDDIKLHRIEAGIEPGNSRSIKLARSLGMRREGLKKRAIFIRNRWVDLTMYTLTSEDVGRKFDTSRLGRKRPI